MSMTDDDEQTEAALAPFLAAARAEAPLPSPELLARVLEAAEAEQARIARPARGPAPRGGLCARIRQGLGGWPALAGLTAAGLAGLWVGLALPVGVLDGGDDYVVDVAPGFAIEAGGDF